LDQPDELPVPDVDDWRLSLDERSRYEEYLRSDLWRARRAVVRRRRYCEACSEPAGSHDVHHRTYPRDFYQADDDLVLLCRTCHDRVHRLMNEEVGKSAAASGTRLRHWTDQVVKEGVGDGVRRRLIVAADRQYELWLALYRDERPLLAEPPDRRALAEGLASLLRGGTVELTKYGSRTASVWELAPASDWEVVPTDEALKVIAQSESWATVDRRVGLDGGVVLRWALRLSRR
jgi:hypothetical protein